MKMKRESWSDFFDGDFTPKNGRIIDAQGKFLVSNCKFAGLNQHAIRFNTSSYAENKLLVEYCYFSDVKSFDNKGSAILFQNSGEVCMNRLCGINCYTNSTEGHFSHTMVTQSKTYSKNYMNFSSIISCGQTKKGYEVCQFVYGKSQMSQTNFSNCKAVEGSAFYFIWTKSPSFSELSVFQNGTVSMSLVAYMRECTDAKIYKSNFINNEKGTCILNYQCDKSVVEDCIFVNNTVNKLFYSTYTTLTIIHCYFEKQEIKYGSAYEGTFDTSSQTTDKFDNKLYDLKPCEALEYIFLMNSKKFFKTCRSSTRDGKLLYLFIYLFFEF